MNAKIKVKNFGPIKDATLDLRNVNVLIGPQASGKSTLAKLCAICFSPVLYLDKHSSLDLKKDIAFSFDLKVNLDLFYKCLNDYSIYSFLKENTYINFDSVFYNLVYEKQKVIFVDKLPDTNLLTKLYEDQGIEQIRKYISPFFTSDSFFRLDQVFLLQSVLKNEKSNQINFNRLTLTDSIKLIQLISEFKIRFYNSQSLYVPADRIIVSLLKQAALNFQRNNIPIPKHLLDFAADYESAISSITEFKLDFIKKGSRYKNQNGREFIFHNKEGSVLLSESASSFQSIIPMLLPIENYLEKVLNKFIVIEELETNLFPKAQYDLLKKLSKKRDVSKELDIESSIFYTTHSPFVLASMNNMLYASKLAGNANLEDKMKIERIIEKDSWIDSNKFSAYQIQNGKTKSIFSRKYGLIDDNVIDSVSQDIMDEFREIALAVTND